MSPATPTGSLTVYSVFSGAGGLDIAADLAGFRPVVGEDVDGALDLTAGFRARLALLAHQRLGDLVLARGQVVRGLAQDGAPLWPRCGAPLVLGGRRSLDGALGVSRPGLLVPGDDLRGGRRVVRLVGLAALRFDPRSVDVIVVRLYH